MKPCAGEVREVAAMLGTRGASVCKPWWSRAQGRAVRGGCVAWPCILAFRAASFCVEFVCNLQKGNILSQLN